ncbi:hypothetical protein VD0001_g102 [Verticillium dahliae]|nr:hypothetical protein VD0001_g102 [Verticillium dahliae]
MAPAATATKDMDLRSGLKRGPPKGSWSNDIKIEEMPSKKNKTSPTQPQRTGLATPSSPQLTDASAPSDDLASLLYSPQVTAKIWGIAQQGFNSPNPPTLFPEYTKPGGTKYVYRELDFWTSGFFPGSLYLLLERQQKYGHRVRTLLSGAGGSADQQDPEPHPLQLEFACKWWTESLHTNALLTNTHDLGFMICPWARPAWDLRRDARAYETTLTAARSLYSRYDIRVGSLRSWDVCITKRYSFLTPDDGILVIIDNMMNLDLLFWAAAQLGDAAMHAAAVQHARTTRKYHVREDSSTCHVVVFEPDTGAFRARITNQGHADGSAWTRGQAWAIAGFAQTYGWTREVEFLDTAAACAEYFLAELPVSRIPPWDFRAPGEGPQPTDTSAAVIAAYGLLLIHEAFVALGKESGYLEHALSIVRAVTSKHINGPSAYRRANRKIQTVEQGEVTETVGIEVEIGAECETILGGATINNYEFAPRRWANHGLVYADYYFLLFGNKLLEMGLDVKLMGGV